jgi:hypothetical protein
MNNSINFVCICLVCAKYYAINELSKILEEFPAGEEEYPGKLLSANMNT